MKKNSLFICLILCLFSCNKESINESALFDNSKQEYDLNIEEAKQIAMDFLQTNTKSQVANITDYKIRHYSISNFHTENMIDFTSDKIPVYEFLTRIDNQVGYTIIIGDKRIQKVLISTKQGSVQDTLFIEPLKEYFRAIPEFIKNDLENYYDSSRKVNLTTKMEVITHYAFIPTIWGQMDPYNRSINYSCGSAKAPAGCVAIALAQIMAYHRVPASLDWNSILARPTVTSSSSQNVITQVANLIAEIGTKVNMSYGCSGSSIPSAETHPRVTGALSSYGFKYSSLQSFSLYPIISSLSYSRPVYMRGNGDTGGHAWVCDGYKQHNYGGGEFYEYLDMNWGWDGSSNGFYYVTSPPSFSNYYRNLQIIPDIRQ